MGGSWLTLRQVIALFVAMGAEPREFPGEDVAPGAAWTVRYLYNPENGAFVSLRDLEPDTLVAPAMLASWERVLRIELPKPDNTH